MKWFIIIRRQIQIWNGPAITVVKQEQLKCNEIGQSTSGVAAHVKQEQWVQRSRGPGGGGGGLTVKMKWSESWF